jgi:hypothetical protein
MGDNTLRDELGWFMACLIILVVSINILVLFFTVLSKIGKYIKKRFAKHIRGPEETVQIKPEVRSSQPFFSQTDQLVVEDVTNANVILDSEFSHQLEVSKVEANGVQSESRLAD